MDFFDHIMHLVNKEEAKDEAQLRAVALFCGNLPDQKLRHVKMTLEFGHARSAEITVVDLDLLPAAFALDLRERIAAGIFEFTPTGTQLEELETAAATPSPTHPMPVHPEMTALCYD